MATAAEEQPQPASSGSGSEATPQAASSEPPAACFRLGRIPPQEGLIFGIYGFGWYARRCDARRRRSANIDLPPPGPEARFQSAASLPEGRPSRFSATSYRTCQESLPEEVREEVQGRAKAALAEEAQAVAAAGQAAQEEASAAALAQKAEEAAAQAKINLAETRESFANAAEAISSEAKTVVDDADAIVGDNVKKAMEEPAESGRPSAAEPVEEPEPGAAPVVRTSSSSQDAYGVSQENAASSQDVAEESNQAGVTGPDAKADETSPSKESTESCPEPAQEPIGHTEATQESGEAEVPQLSEEEKASAAQLTKFIFELCDTDGVRSISVEALAEMCANHKTVAEFLGVDKLSKDEALKKLSAQVAHSGQISFDDFEKLTNPAAAAAAAPRMSSEEKIDLIFESCDVQKRGEISLAAFAAFCIKRPNVSAVVGMKKAKLSDGKRKRVGTDDLFAQIDTDGSGKVSRQELRAFVWKQHARALEDTSSPPSTPSKPMPGEQSTSTPAHEIPVPDEDTIERFSIATKPGVEVRTVEHHHIASNLEDSLSGSLAKDMAALASAAEDAVEKASDEVQAVSTGLETEAVSDGRAATDVVEDTAAAGKEVAEEVVKSVQEEAAAPARDSNVSSTKAPTGSSSSHTPGAAPKKKNNRGGKNKKK